MAPGQIFVKGWIISSIQLIDHHLPYRVRPAGTAQSVPVALVRHSEVQGVGPDGYTGQCGGDRRVVDEKLIRHHLKLFVSSNSEERGSDS